MGQKGTFPPKENNDLTGVVFKSLKITHADAIESPAANTTGAQTSGGPESAEVARTSLQMLDGSQYSHLLTMRSKSFWQAVAILRLMRSSSLDVRQDAKARSAPGQYSKIRLGS